MLKLYPEEAVQSIASAIRAKNGTSSLYKIGEMAQAVADIPTGGGDEDFVNLVERTGYMTYSNNNVSIIGIGAFAYYNTLSEVCFPNASVIGTSAFASCRQLASGSFQNLKSIYDYAFANCNSLQSIYAPLLDMIGTGAFMTASFKSFENDLITHIASSVFVACRSLVSISCNSVRSVYGNAFSSCIALHDVKFPNLETIYAGAFNACNNLQSINFSKVTMISNQAFYQCSQLNNANLPVLETIGSNAFGECKILPSISLPSVKSIYSSAFYRCYNLLSVYLLGSSMASLLQSNAFTSTPIAGYTASTGGVYGSIFVPASLYDQYISASNWSYFSSRFVSV